MTSASIVDGRAPGQFEYRPVRTDEIGACAEIWRVAINDYVVRLGQSELQEETGPLQRLYGHLQSTDPERFVVAVDTDERVTAFAAAVMRERMWFLSMLFVLPEAQGAGIGRELLRRVGPPPDADVVRGTATDSLQPISNALYASVGIVPRVPLFNLVGRQRGPEAFGDLPSGVRPVAFEDLAGGTSGGDGHRRLADTVDALDREMLGVAHPIDHRWIRQEGRRGYLFNGPDGESIGYGYASESGRVGPIAVRDAELMAPVIGWLLSTVQARGAYAIWLPGTADGAIVGALRAGMRFDEFPLLLCWDRPFVDVGALRAYLPRTALDATGPDHRPGCRVVRLARLPVRGAGGSLGCDVAPRTVPADGVESNPETVGWRPSSPSGPPAESNVTIAPAPARARSLRSRILERGRDQAVQERSVLVLHDVTKQYPNGKIALRDVDLVIPEGDFVFLVGPSGAGKSTLIKLLIRDEIATRGQVVLDGHDLARLPRRQVPKMRRKIGIIFQDFKLLPTKTVWENVAFALEVTGIHASSSRRRSTGCWRSSD